jgi:hypothetical protein
MSYHADIIKALSKFGNTNGTVNPDGKHNTGRMLGEAFMWEQVAKYAEGRADAVWAEMLAEGIVPKKENLKEGEQEIAYSPNFVVIGKVTAPVKRFNGEELAQMLAKSKYRVPMSTTKEMIDKAKVPTNPMRSLKVIERSGT